MFPVLFSFFAGKQVLVGELCARIGPSVEVLRFGDSDKLTAGTKNHPSAHV